jgi:hypothetical protein
MGPILAETGQRYYGHNPGGGSYQEDGDGYEDHCEYHDGPLLWLAGVFGWLQPVPQPEDRHPWRPRNHHPFTTDRARIGEDGNMGERYPAGLAQREAEVLGALGAHLAALGQVREAVIADGGPP